MPKISVIVPVYQVEKYIYHCVNSILAQTFSDYELILVDDGSPDKCGDICDKYASKDRRIRVIHQNNQGLSAARNNAVQIATAEWILFVDSDDQIHAQMLEHMYNAIEMSHANICVCSVAESETAPASFLHTVINRFSSWNYSQEEILRLYHTGKQKYWIACAKMVRKEILQKFPFTLGRIHEDNAVVFKWFHEAKTIAEMDYSYYFYRINQSGITQSPFSLKKLDLLWALQEQIVFYDTIGFENMKKQVVAYYLKVGSWYLPKVCDLLHDRKKAAEIRHTMRKYMCQFDLDQLPLTSEEKDLIRLVTPSIAKRIKRKIGKMLKIHTN
ncbi:MAG: glycosyltransferase family 2 protein [Clostridia bacterium]|nr:glycosyltransferase family 2 protein [Clostridia bacterium]